MFRLPTRWQRVPLTLVCALLLFAQHVGLVHAVAHAAHAAHNGPAIPEYIEQHTGDKPAQGQLSRICALDAVLAQVLGGAPLASHSFDTEKLSTHLPAPARFAFATLEAPAPRSRGPPSSL